MRVGLVGCGPWGANILRDLTILGCDVTVAARHASTQARAASGGAARVVTSWSALVELAGELDGLVVANESSGHAEALRLLVGLGKPIFVEKPLCVDPDEASRLAESGGGQIFLMDKWRYHAGIATLADVSRSGRLGRVLGVRTRRNQWGSAHRDVDELWTLMPHDLAVVEQILGVLPPTRSVVADRVDGAVGCATVVFGQAPWAVVECLGRSPVRERAVTVFGTVAVAQLATAEADEVVVYPIVEGPADASGVADGAVAWRIPVVGEWPLLAELRDFVGFLGGGPAPRATVADGARHVHRIAEILAMANHEGR